MIEKKSNSVVSIGTIYLDINATNFPSVSGIMPEEETVGGEYEVVPGGSAVNFSRLISKLEMESTFVGKVGKDNIADLGKMLEKEGVSASLITGENEQTNIGINLVDKNGKRVMIVLGTANQSLSEDDLNKSVPPLFDSSKYFYMGGVLKMPHLISAYVNLAKTAKGKDTISVLDHGRITNNTSDSDKKEILELIEDSTYYLPSKEEFLEITDSKDIEEGLRTISSLQTTVVVKSDADGAYSLVGGRLFNSPSFKVELKNTVGAGDSFNAGFIKSISDGYGLEKAMDYANATAAMKISSVGITNFSSVKEFASSNSRRS